MKRVILESPFAGKGSWRLIRFINRILNRRYARACLRDSLLRGEAPLASHLLYTQKGVLDDNVPRERDMGIGAGLAWYRYANLSAVYVDRGISGGMRMGIERARQESRDIEYRQIRRKWLRW